LRGDSPPSPRGILRGDSPPSPRGILGEDDPPSPGGFWDTKVPLARRGMFTFRIETKKGWIPTGGDPPLCDVSLY